MIRVEGGEIHYFKWTTLSGNFENDSVIKINQINYFDMGQSIKFN